MFRVGEFARLNGLSARTLRAWDELGVFRPAWVDPATGYRGYSAAQIPDLRRIVALRDLGVPLAELVALTGHGDDLREVLARRRRALERERREVARRLRALEISVSMAGDDAGGGGRADVVVRPLEPQAVALLRVPPPGADLNAAFYALEAEVRDLGRRAAAPPGAILHPVRPDGVAPVDVWVPVTGRPRPARAGSAVRWDHLPAVRAATLLHHGPYDGLGEARVRLERRVAAAGHATTGRLRVVYLQFGAEPELRVPSPFLVRRDADFVTELQLELR